MSPQDISALIDQSPMNRGVSGVEWLADPRNLAFAVGPDVMLFQQVTPWTYEFHWLVTSSPVREKIKNTLYAFDEMFRTSPCKIIFGMIPSDRRDSKLMARWIGAQYFCKEQTEHGPVDVFFVTREMRERKN